MNRNDYEVYVVETTWPGTRSPPKFGRYNVTAYNDKRNPGTRKYFGSTIGTFDQENADVCEVPERIQELRDGWTNFRDIFAFTDLGAAVNCASRLALFGEIAAVQDSHGHSYKGALKVRVVQERLVRTQSVIATFEVNSEPRVSVSLKEKAS